MCSKNMMLQRAPHLRTAAFTAALCVIAMLGVAAPDARAADLLVRYDQSQLIRLPRAASEVIIGNPSIADVAIQGGNLLVVTGKTFGVTNIIALDAQRNIIQDQRVIVQRDEQRMLVVYRGPSRESYTCTPYCSPTVTIGDEQKFFETVSKHGRIKTSGASGLTGNSPGNEPPPGQ